MENNKLGGLILTTRSYIPISKDERKNENKIKNILILNLKIIFFLLIIFSFLLYFIIIKPIKKKLFSENQSFLSNKSFNKNIIDDIFLNSLKSFLKEDEILENEIMSRHTTFKLGGSAKIFVKPKTINQIIEIIKLCNKYNVNYFILGNGSNLLVSDNGYYGVIIQIHEYNFSNLKVKKEDDNNYILTVEGGMLMKTLSIESCLLSLTGLEDIIDIPGTVGGGIIMNASFRGAGLSKCLKKVKVITSEGKILELTKEECKLSRRGSMLKEQKYLVIEAVFKLKKGDQMKIQKKMTNNTKMRYEKQPMYFGSAGCFFVWDHSKFGSMYEKYKESNLVSYRIGNIMIYTYNIAFIVNLGNGKASHVIKIVEYIEKIMKEKYNIEIRREVILIGTFNNIEYY